jgi:hypothetical protein
LPGSSHAPSTIQAFEDEMIDVTVPNNAFTDIHKKLVVEPGEFEIMVNVSSHDCDLQKLVLTVEG